MTFPTAGSQIHRNEDGEVLGWDSPPYDDAPGDDELPDYFEDEPDDDDDEDED